MSPAVEADLEAVLRLLDDARAWHRQQGVDEWREFDRATLAQDIARRAVYVARRGAAVVGTVTLLEDDVLIWKDARAALYVHRLTSLRAAAGRGIGALLLQWARGLARHLGRACVRLETWDGNARLRAYYEEQGFRHVGDRYFPPDSPLPADYRGSSKSLYELEL